MIPDWLRIALRFTYALRTGPSHRHRRFAAVAAKLDHDTSAVATLASVVTSITDRFDH